MSASQKHEPIKTILVICLGLVIIYLFTNYIWLLHGAVIIGGIGLISEVLAKKIDWLWMKLAFILGLIVPNILLSIIFYLFLTPLALTSKIFGKKNMLTLKNSKPSLFNKTSKTFEKASFEKPW